MASDVFVRRRLLCFKQWPPRCASPRGQPQVAGAPGERARKKRGRSLAEPGAQGSGARPGAAGDSDRGCPSSLADLTVGRDTDTAALAPLRSIRWKNFPAPLTSQPCHLPAAAWIRNAALNPRGAGGRRPSGQPRSGLCGVLPCLLRACLCLSPCSFFFFSLIKEKMDGHQAFPKWFCVFCLF